MQNKIIIQDTREQANKHDYVLDWFEKNNYKVVRSKLFVGDYTFLDKQSICVDTKKDLLEVIGNVTKQHKRFVDELKRASENGIKLYILVCEDEISELADVNRWYNPRLKYNPKSMRGTTLFKILFKIEKEYNTKFYFTSKEKCGEMIIKLLEKEI